jgi:hypothetical protein
MEIRFLCVQNGRQYFEVVLSGEQIFVGTRGECARFQKIHEEKVALAQEEALRLPRSRAIPVRTYRAAARVRA